MSAIDPISLLQKIPVKDRLAFVEAGRKTRFITPKQISQSSILYKLAPGFVKQGHNLIWDAHDEASHQASRYVAEHPEVLRLIL